MVSELRTLNRRWRKHLLEQGVVKRSEQWTVGGPLFPAAYAKAKTRILWVLKETGDKEGRIVGPSLASFVKRRIRVICEKSQDTYYRVGFCTYGLLNPQATLSSAKEKENVEDGLRHCAVINLKKTAGYGTCIAPKVKRFACRTLALWMTEIAILEPDLVVAGGTFWWMVTPAGLDDDCCYYRKKTSRVVVPSMVLSACARRADHPIRIVEFPHPRRTPSRRLWTRVQQARRYLYQPQ